MLRRRKLISHPSHPHSPAQLLLFEAERAWAHSQDLREQSFANDQDAALRDRGLSRLRRAVQWSSQLSSLLVALGDRSDVQSRAEAVAFHGIMKSAEVFDKGRWEPALDYLSVSRALLTVLADCSNSSRAEALANSFVDAGEAQMRFCAYQLGLAEQNMEKVAATVATPEKCEECLPGYAKLVAELREKKETEGGKATKHTIELSWHGRQIPIRNPELMDTIVRVREEEEALQRALVEGQAEAFKAAPKKTSKDGKRPRLSHKERTAKKTAAASGGSSNTARVGQGGRTEMDPYDRALAALGDAEDVARRLVEDNASALAKSHSQRYEAQSADFRLAHDYLLYRLLSVRIARNVRLVEEVQAKANRREERAVEQMKRKLERAAKGKERRLKKKAADAQKDSKAPKQRSRPKRARPAPYRRKPARSGARTLRQRLLAARTARAEQIGAEKARRRGARAVPAVAKLLDAAAESLGSIGALALIEAEPDVSSLVEAKAAWYRAELLRHLARAFALGGAYPETLLLLARAGLFVRQARQSAELAEDAQAEDAEIPPLLKDETFARLEAQIQGAQQAAQHGHFFALHAPKAGAASSSAANHGRPALGDTKAAAALRELAAKYVDFDPNDLRDAAVISPQRTAELEAELEERRAKEDALRPRERPAEVKTPAAKPAAAKTPAKPAAKPAAAFAQPAPAPKKATSVAAAKSKAAPAPASAPAPAQAQETEAQQSYTPGGGAYDPGNEMEAEEEEEEQASGGQKSGVSGWLGGWFGRK